MHECSRVITRRFRNYVVNDEAARTVARNQIVSIVGDNDEDNDAIRRRFGSASRTRTETRTGTVLTFDERRALKDISHESHCDIDTREHDTAHCVKRYIAKRYLMP